LPHGNREKLVLNELERKISDPKASLDYIYSSSDWKLFIQEIENGNIDFLDTWSLLRDKSDGGATEELNLALSVLLKKKPELVFTTITNKNSDKEKVETIVSEVCKVSGQEVQNTKYPTVKDEKNAALNGLNQRLKELSKMRSMTVLKNLCEIEINKNIKFWSSK
jgi:hypothetical protein